MKVNKAELVISGVGVEQYPTDNLPEIALAGRSNVGKSSLINRLIQRKSLVRTSSNPGKTQTLNFYLINEQFFIVDVPGYGYAKVSKAERLRWGSFIEEYLTVREELRVVVLLIDLRHPPTKDDIAMYEWLKYHELPVIVVGTKSDKLNRGKWAQQKKQIKETLQMDPEDKLLTFSAVKGYGYDELWQELMPYIFL